MYVAERFDHQIRILDHRCPPPNSDVNDLVRVPMIGQPECVEGHGFEACIGWLSGYDLDCSGCGHLLGYDSDEGRYVCVSCGAVYRLQVEQINRITWKPDKSRETGSDPDDNGSEGAP